MEHEQWAEPLSGGSVGLKVVKNSSALFKKIVFYAKLPSIMKNISYKIFIILGVLMILTALSGFSVVWKEFLFYVWGILTIALAVWLKTPTPTSSIETEFTDQVQKVEANNFDNYFGEKALESESLTEKTVYKPVRKVKKLRRPEPEVENRRENAGAIYNSMDDAIIGVNNEEIH